MWHAFWNVIASNLLIFYRVKTCDIATNKSIYVSVGRGVGIVIEFKYHLLEISSYLEQNVRIRFLFQF